MNSFRPTFDGLCFEDKRQLLTGIESILVGVTNHLKLRIGNPEISSEALKTINEAIELQKVKEALRNARRELTHNPEANLDAFWGVLNDYFAAETFEPTPQSTPPPYRGN